MRGDGILTDDGLEWINSNTNEFLTQNPVYLKHKSEKKKIKLSKLERRSEKVTVNELPDEVGKSVKNYPQQFGGVFKKIFLKHVFGRFKSARVERKQH